MEFKSQKVAYPYFFVAVLLFTLQLLMGLWLVANYFHTIPQDIVNIFPFSTARAFHTNLLVLWLLLGFMGGTYYLVPDETKREIFSTALAYLQLGILLVAGVGGLISIFMVHGEGKPLLEIPFVFDVLIVAGALIFLFNVGMTLFLAKRWTVIQGTLFGGLVFLALLYLFDLPFYKNLTIDWYYWWWVIHLWVEGAWELVTGAIMAWVLLKLTGVKREVVEKWLYIEIGLFLFTGIAGTGHHYYWLGAPKYWLWVGGIFSALEPVPIIFMVFDTLSHVKKSEKKIENGVVLLYAVGCAVYHLLGAGVWGFLHTLPQINRFTHGSQVTVSHGHLAFFGAYALLNLMMIYYAVPEMRGFKKINETPGKVAFWIMSIAMLFMGLGFGVAGVLQAYLERVMGLGYMYAQNYMKFWFEVVFAMGFVFLIGQIVFLINFFTMKEERSAT